MVIQRLKERFKAIPWRKTGLGLFVFVLMVLAFLGGHLSMDWYLRASESADWQVMNQNKFGSWQVYKNETYGFGLRYPKDWEAEEVKPGFIVFKPQVAEGGEPVKEYISLAVTSNKNRGKTVCEEDQSQCSFHTNGIFGERITTPETEIVFFAHGENDLTLTLYRYDSSDEVWEGYVTIFEEMAKSFRFTSEVTSACEKDTDCALGIRLDQCCACAEAFTKSEVGVNPAIAPFEKDKDYSGEKLVDCTSVYCSPCPTPPSGAVCVLNRCKAKEE